ncbi:pullulanase [Paenibacillus methanolicus]|uniref:pullulanase n=1 Tax=Paenibacillus methanolicus TaxID=582686 RepID=A0A5S5BU21_9BACL|nr:pullulanase [Paenibacillus methanolicus]TYP70509.1 secreted pullulanase [Paenibacillus methanolicus]
MKFRGNVRRAFAYVMIAALLISSIGLYPNGAGAANRTAYLVGDLQSKLILGSGQTPPTDWKQDAEATRMTDLGGGYYAFTGELPAGTYQYKVALDGKWDESYGFGSYTNPQGTNKDGNIQFTLTEPKTVTFYYNDTTKKIADSTFYAPVAADKLPFVAGNVKVVDDASDTTPSDAAIALSDPDFDNVYTSQVYVPQGSYGYQVSVPGADGADNALYPAQAASLTLPSTLQVTFKFNAVTHDVNADFTVPPVEVPEEEKPEAEVPQVEAPPVPEGHMRVHYQRTNHDYADQGLWTWDDVQTPTSGWPNGAMPFPAGQMDDYGAYIDVPLKAGAKKISFLVVDRVSGSKDGGDKIYTIPNAQTNEFWIKQGSDVVTPYPPAADLAEGSVRIHYTRSDDKETDYGLWLWDDVAKTSDANGGQWPTAATPFAKTDRFGAYVDVPLKANAQKIGLIVMKPVGGDKDNENRTFAMLSRYNQLWLKENDTKVYVSPFGETADIFQSAEVLSTSKLLLGFALTSGLNEAALLQDLTVKDKDGAAIKATGATILDGTQVQAVTEPFELAKLPLSISYEGKTVSAASGWRLLDEMYRYTGDDLGAAYDAANKTATLKLWAPLATRVVAKVYDKADASKLVGSVDLAKGEQGVWSVDLKPADLTDALDVRGYYYQYEVTNNGVTKQVLDPYAKSMAAFTVNTKDEAGADGDNVGKAAIVDLSGTDPEGFGYADIAGYEKREDAIMYEVHVRDFTSDPSVEISLNGERWGSYDAFIQKLDYIKSLGVTHIQLLPVMAWYYGDETKMGERELDYSAKDNEFNWGYDPHSYFSPDGAYSQDPTDPELRIQELKRLIDAVHEAGMGVVLDVVYTHMSKQSLLGDIVPNYYAFQDANGNFLGDFHNNLATSHKMAEKLMIDSVKYWFEEYKIDGMRWDMMGDATQQSVQNAYNAAIAINPKALFIGEGWKTFKGAIADPSLAGQGADQAWMDKTNDVGVFSDEIRNELKSGYGSEGEPRFITGGARPIATILNNIKAQPANTPADDPGDMVNYIEAHDNLTLHDVIAQSIKKDPSVPANELEIQKRIRLGNTLIMTSQGTAFMQAGQEYGRTKQWKSEGVPEHKHTELKDASGKSFGYFIHDSYDSSDAVNMFDWSKVTDASAYPVQNQTKDYTAGLIELRKSTNAFRLGDQAAVDQNVTLVTGPEIKSSDLLIAYKNRSTDGTGSYYVFMNADSTPRTLTLPEDLTAGQVLADNDQAGVEAIPAAQQSGFALTATTLTLDPLTSVVIRMEPNAELLTLEIDSEAYALQVGKTHQTTVTAKYADGSKRAVTGAAVYASNKPGVATVTSAGVVQGVSAGTAKITASYGGVTKTLLVNVTNEAADNKRYVLFTYVRPDRDYTDWNMWVWGTGAKNDQIDFTMFENGNASVLIEVHPQATSVGFVLRKGTDWNTAKQDFPDDRNIPLTAGQALTKVVVTSMEREINLVPANNGPIYEDGGITLVYRDEALFKSGDMAEITDVKLKIGGQTYPMVYDAAKEWFAYKLTGVQEGDHPYSFLVTKNGETTEIADPKNGDTALVYRNPEVTITSAAAPNVMNANTNAVLTVSAKTEEGILFTKGYLDLTALGGPSNVSIDTTLMKHTIAVKDTVGAGAKTIPVVLVDQYGNVHRHNATVTVQARTYTGSELDFDWDEARIYFALTDRFNDGDATNNKNVDKTHLEAYHGGDFKGMIDKLDYLEELGINTLWITPIVDNIDFNQGAGEKWGTQYGYHGYWAKDFTQLDEHLGDMDTFKELIDKAHDRGIKIMVDVVLNHTGYGLKPGDKQDVAIEDKQRFNGMLRTDGLSADVNPIKGELAFLPDFITEDEAVRNQVIEWQTGWLENVSTDRGDTIDYFRVDTVKHVEDTTWKAFKNALTAIDPSFKLVGEYFGGTVNNDGGMLQSGQMDSLLDFGFKERAKQFTDGQIDAVDTYLQDRENSIDNTKMMAQFLSSHDENGFLSDYVGGDKGKLKIAAALQITAKGQPVVYYGEELGNSGKNANMQNGLLSENRKDMPWNKLEEEKALHDHYEKLLNIRAEYSKVFAKGTRTKLAGSDALGYLAFNKHYGNVDIVTAINTKAEAVKATIPVPFGAYAIIKDIYGGSAYTVSYDGTVAVDLPSRSDGGTAILTFVANGSGYVPAPTAPNASADAQVVTEAELKNGKDGQAEVTLSAGKTEALLPIDAAKTLGASDLLVKSGDMTAVVPNEVLSAISQLVSGAEAAGARIAFAANPLPNSEAQALVQGLSKGSTSANAVSEVVDFTLAVVKKDGTRQNVSAFEQPITLSFRLKDGANPDLLGVYFIGADGKLEWMGGTVKDGIVTAQVTHFSTYAALEIRKSFADVPAGFWAQDAIQSLAAKQIATGVTADAFKPGQAISRAEFTALLARALGLAAEGQAAYADTPAGAWYSAYVAAAVKAGIVDGVGGDKFAPNWAISREEMAVMLVRALEAKQGKSAEPAAASGFADRTAISGWAAVSVDTAAQLGLVQGQSGNRFAPQAKLTRAEAAQVVYTLLGKLQP